MDETVVDPSLPAILTPDRLVSRQLLYFKETSLAGPSTVVLGYLIVLAAPAIPSELRTVRLKRTIRL